MKLATDSGQTYPVTLENGFGSFHTVPNEYTLVATRASGTDTGTLAIGSTITATYQVYISSTQNAGTYYGQVKYMMVHPSNANVNWVLNYNANGGTNAPAAGRGFVTGDSYSFRVTSDEPTRDGYIFTGWSESSSATIPDYSAGDTYTTTTASSTLYAVWVEDRTVSLVYDGNSADAGSIPEIGGIYNFSYTFEYYPIEYGNTIHLLASNYSRAGYGFAGWSTTQLNPNSGTFATDFAALAASDGIYGSNQVITADAAFLSSADVNDVVTLYAVWVPVARTSGNTELTFQTDNLLRTMLSDGTTLASKPIRYVTALKDTRDNEVYAITKVEDGSWWMIENLRLDLDTASITSANTNNPTASFLSELNSVSSSNSWCWEYSASCTDQVLYNSNNTNRTLPANPDVFEDTENNTYTSWYSYGMYYNWYTATAGNGNADLVSYYDDSLDDWLAPSAAGDICPAGWRLPLHKNSSSLGQYDPYVSGSAMSLIVNSFDGSIEGVYSFDYATSRSDLYSKFPFNYIFSGTFGSDRFITSALHTSSVDIMDIDDFKMTVLEYDDHFGYENIDEVGKYRTEGIPVRCVAVP